MVLLVYDMVWRLLRPLIPLILWYRTRRGKEMASRRLERYGRSDIPANKLHPSVKGRIWLHGVSVGETVAALRLARALADHLPDHEFLLTTNTVTGLDVIQAAMAEHPDMPVRRVIQPLDHPDFVDQFLTHWHPVAAIFMESDFWPNHILRSKQFGILVIFASSQLSKKAAAKWIKRPAFAKQLFAAADLILPVDSDQAEQFRRLIGTTQNAPHIEVIGSLKLPDTQIPDLALQQILRNAAAGRRVAAARDDRARAPPRRVRRASRRRLGPPPRRPSRRRAPRRGPREGDAEEDMGARGLGRGRADDARRVRRDAHQPAE